MILNLIRDSFPQFPNLHEVDENDVPSLGDDNSWISVDQSGKTGQTNSSTGSVVEQFNQREAAYRKKEDQDVAVFLSLVDRMSVQSLLFILQAHAKSMHSVEQSQLQATLQKIEQEKKSPRSSNKRSSDSSNSSNGSSKKAKQFRFAMVMGGQRVREEIFEIPHCDEYTEQDKATLWWSKVDQRCMQKEAARTVRFFRSHRPEYIESVEVLANSATEDDDIWVEHHMKKLTNNSFPRGLECHIVPCLARYRDAGVHSVIAAQHRYLVKRADDPFADEKKHEGDQSDDRMWEEIREAYVKASVPCQEFARLIAECDHVEALKACISRWEAY
eukprot:CAMPEP_0168765858 /NCGR_PEP_ID=MMETSP0725-20121227/541_1 /TAXON_ID=265536 /ORGANISM="Amphiprora sp., Strain CCMP467" /LENGTH=329 /DNA_ID=CAMNT_0008815125 /DNA_START=369 /DNA_END=1358 /DNA_ORIENTATION=-